MKTLLIELGKMMALCATALLAWALAAFLGGVAASATWRLILAGWNMI